MRIIEDYSRDNKNNVLYKVESDKEKVFEKAEIAALKKRLDEYISHIESLENVIFKYRNKKNIFEHNEEKAEYFEKILDTLKTILPVKKEIYTEVIELNKKNTNYKHNKLLLQKFKEGHGVHDIKKALAYWDKENFFKTPPTKISVLKKKIIKSLSEITSNTFEGIRLIETPFPSIKDLVVLIIGEDKNQEANKIDD